MIPPSPVGFSPDVATHQPSGPALEHISVGERIANLLGISLPFAAFISAIWALWGRGFGWVHGSLLLVMYLTTAIGVTVGYHRLFCHRSFKTNRVIQCILAVLGSMAFEGSVIKWCAMHRCHHQHSDRPGDPHSPHHSGEGFWGVLTGMWHAHVGWIFRGDPTNLSRYIPDLQGDRMIRIVSKLWVLWAILGLVVPSVLCAWLTHSWMGLLLGFIWCGLARVFLVHHVTWSINSVCHIWGSRPFDSHDHSRNNLLFGIVGLGEGWHNNHHAFPTSARHGLRWWQFDASYYIILALSWVGLAWDIKVPNGAMIAMKMGAT